MTSQNLLLYRKSLLARVHTHRSCVELKRCEGWEAYLEDNFSTDSSAKLSINELKLLLDMLDGNFVAPRKIDIAGRQMVARATKKLASLAQIKRIDELRVALGWNKKELSAFIARHLHIIVDISRLDPKSATKLIYMLTKVAQYQRNKE